MSVYAVLLAAGASRRFGATAKQAQVWRGQSLLGHMLQRSEAVLPGRVRVVLGANYDTLAPLVQGAPIYRHAHWAQGLGSSLAFGVAQLPADASAALIVLADQLAVSTADLQRLLTAAGDVAQAVIACATYEGRRGAPALFSSHFFAQLQRLTGEQGAKPLLSHPATRCVPMPSAAFDIDTPDDFAHFLKCRETASAKAIHKRS